MILKAATAAAERSLTQSEVHWRYLWDNMPDKIAEIDLEANILVANKAFMTASSQQEPYKNLYECVPTEYRKDLKLAIHRAHLSGKNQLYEFPKLEANKTIWWSKQIFPIVARNEIKSFLVIVSDVTERKLAYQKIEQQVQERTQVLLRINQELKDEIYTRKQIESALRESEGRYYRLTAISPVGIFRTDMDGRTVYMNERCAEMIGLPMDEALGHGWTKTLHPDDYDRVTRESYYAWENQLAYKTKHRYLHKDCSVIWVVAEFLK